MGRLSALRGKDVVTPIGVAAGVGCVFAMMTIIGLRPTVLIAPGPLVLVIGGTIAAASAGVTFGDLRSMPRVLLRALVAKEVTPLTTISRMVELAKIARREGLLALDREAEAMTDPFFKKGLQMVVDGLDPEEIRSVLESEITSLKARHRRGAKYFLDMGGYSPTLGILGTVIGLVKVLAAINNVKGVGPAVAGAFVATLWGVFMANLVWIPIATKLTRVSESEYTAMELLVEGLLAIQAGSSPARLEARLLTFLPPATRAEAATTEEAA
jgi:chemotaxis protein MotA